MRRWAVDDGRLFALVFAFAFALGFAARRVFDFLRRRVSTRLAVAFALACRVDVFFFAGFARDGAAVRGAKYLRIGAKYCSSQPRSYPAPIPSGFSV
jgi:hypothetical protein